MKLDEVSRNYDPIATHHDGWSDLVLGRLLRIVRHRREAVGQDGDVRGRTLLDIGCGMGRNAMRFIPAGTKTSEVNT